MALFFIAPAADVPAHFLDDAVHPSIPTGAVRITTAVFQRMLAARSEGREILADADGKPKAGPKPVETIADLRTRMIARVKAESGRRISIASPIWKQINDMALLGSAATNLEKAPPLARSAAVDAIRTASNVLEARIAKMKAPDLQNLDITCDIHWVP
jgi:hypothetical protein